MGDGGNEVWLLRRAVVRHPVHDWSHSAVDQATLSVHRGFCHWASSLLAGSLDMTGGHRHLTDITAGLRDRGAGRCLDDFLRAVQQGMSPACALPAVGGPPAAAALVEVTCRLAREGTEAARLGAFGLGLVCCGRHQGPALARLAGMAAAHPGGENETEDETVEQATGGALVVLRAQVTLYDGALDKVRQRHMACHPSTFRRGSGAGRPTDLLRLLPAG